MAGGDVKPTGGLSTEIPSAVTSPERPGEPRPRLSQVGLHATGMTPTPMALTRLGRYQVVTRIATGGMAEVYLAVHGEMAGFRTPVVVKKVLPHLACNQQFIDMFLDEARIASLLDHPNVVRINEVGRSGTEYFLAMELVQGRPMAALVRRVAEIKKPLDPKIAAFIVASAAHGLQHAHELRDPLGNLLGLVHRDISPQNIMISFEGSVKVIDFGIARALGRITDTNTGSMKGKFGYMSPEQAKGEEVDKRTDIFALGVVLWEAVCGKRLFSRDNDLATMRALIYDPIPKPSSVVPIAPDLETIILKALARNPKQRYSTARELAAVLEKFLAQEGGTGTADVAEVMKSIFATEIVAWQQSLRAALAASPAAPDVTPTFVPLPPMTGTQIPIAKAPRPLWLPAAIAGGVILIGIIIMLLLRPSPPAVTRLPPPTIPAREGPRVEQLPTAPVVEPAISKDTASDENRRPKVRSGKRRVANTPAGTEPPTPANKRPNPF